MHDVDINFDIQMLPDGLGINLKGKTCTLAPGLNMYWLYNHKHECSLGNGELIAINSSLMSGNGSGDLQLVVDANDLVKFLYIGNNDTNTIYVSFNGVANAFTASDSIKIFAGQAWFGVLNNTPYENIQTYATVDDTEIEFAAIIQKV